MFERVKRNYEKRKVQNKSNKKQLHSRLFFCFTLHGILSLLFMYTGVIMSILVGILAIAFGAILIIYTEWFVSNLGRSAWAEEKLGASGGTRLFYKLIGLGIIFLSLMAMTGFLGDVILGVFGNMFSGLAPTS